MITKEEATKIALNYLATEFSDITEPSIRVHFGLEDVEHLDLFHYIKDSPEDYIGHWDVSFDATEEISYFLIISAKTGKVWGYSTPHRFIHA